MAPKQFTWAAFVAASTLAASAACNRSSEQKRHETERAMVEAGRATAKAEEQAAKKAQAAEQKVAKKATEFLAAVVREKADYTYKTQVELDRIDKKLVDLKVDARPDDATTTYDESSKDAPEIARLLKRRDALRTDLQLIEVVPPHDWPTFKARIDRDLAVRPTLPPDPRYPRYGS